jgi:Helix-turn-helix domain
MPDEYDAFQMDFYKAGDVASYFSISPRYVYDLCDSGKLEAVTLTARAVRITGRSVRSWGATWKR